MLLQYRAAAVAGFGTQLFFGLILTMAMSAFYSSSSHSQPMTHDQVITYIWLGQAMLGIFPWNADSEVQMMIRSGTVVYELLRPVDLYNMWFSRAFAVRTAPTLLRSIPMFIIAGLFFGMKPPDSIASGCLWVAGTICALLLACAMTTLLAITMLWTVSGDGINRLTIGAMLVFSGMLVPLPLFPPILQPLISFLPFRGLTDTPFRLYTGHIPPGNAAYAIAQQILWTIILILIGRLVLARGLRRLTVQGG
jgi:ABC-2 type transport system permease protein